MRVAVVDAAGQRHSASLPFAGADHVVIARCPDCGQAPCRVRGTGITHHDHDTYYARAVALCCRAAIGGMETKVETIFGIKEDEAVLNGRPRVY